MFAKRSGKKDERPLKLFMIIGRQEEGERAREHFNNGEDMLEIYMEINLIEQVQTVRVW